MRTIGHVEIQNFLLLGNFAGAASKLIALVFP